MQETYRMIAADCPKCKLLVPIEPGTFFYVPHEYGVARAQNVKCENPECEHEFMIVHPDDL